MGVVRTSAAIATAAGFFAVTSPADAGSVVLGGNWEASWDDSLDGLVQIIVDGVVGDTIFIQKAATFNQGPDQFGFIPAIPITFRQLGASGINHIVINDEIITNLTGVTWTDFHLDLIDSGDAVFNPAATLASGGGGPIGWSIAPFTNAAFSLGNTRLDIFGGPGVAHGDVWFPGDGAFDGQLWIDVVSASGQQGDPFTVFTLKETPTIPGPAALALLGIGAIAGRSRRRS
jgi:MYXO-CTERM domain-containing protein